MRIPFFHSRTPVVPVIRLTGIIAPGGRGRGTINVENMAGILDRAFSVRGACAVALDVNSPGGSPVQSALVYKRIRALAEEKELPVLAFTQDVAASGGYWLACAADEIFADESSILGSIGVISSGFGLQGLLERVGVERRVHTSGARKGFLDPFLPEDPEDVRRLEALQGEIHQSFRELVRERRGARLKGADDQLFSGEFWTGRKALDLGLIDGLGDLRSVLRQRFGEKVKMRTFGVQAGWLRRRLGAAATDRVASDWAEGVITALDARALWSRYGL